MIDSLPKILESTAQIRFQDCDPFNHLNNASYINYLVNAREDQLIKHYDIDIYAHAQKYGTSWVTGSNQIAYLKPAFLMEKVCIQSQLIEYSKRHLKVEMRMYNNNKTELKAIMWSNFVHFDLKKNIVAEHYSELMTLFTEVIEPVNEKSFEVRVQSLKTKTQS